MIETTLVTIEICARESDFEKLNTPKVFYVLLLQLSNDGFLEWLEAFSVRICLIEESPEKVGCLAEHL